MDFSKLLDDKIAELERLHETRYASETAEALDLLKKLINRGELSQAVRSLRDLVSNQRSTRIDDAPERRVL